MAGLTPAEQLSQIEQQLDRWEIKKSSKFDGRYNALSRIRLLRNTHLKIVHEQRREIERLQRQLAEAEDRLDDAEDRLAGARADPFPHDPGRTAS